MSHIFKKKEETRLSSLAGVGPVLAVSLGWENDQKDGIINKLLDKREEADLDLSCVVYDIYNERMDCVWYAQLKSKDGAIRHSGDHTEGEDASDDEAIIVDLNHLNEQTQILFFVISSFSENSFSCIREAHWRLLDAQTKKEIGRYKIAPKPANDESTAKIVLRLKKTVANGLTEWALTALDEPATGQNVQEVFSEIRGLIEA